MKYAFAFIAALFVSPGMAFEPADAISKLQHETDSTLILAGLHQLAEDNSSFIANLRQEKSYRPEELYLALNLKYYLLPVRAEMNCENYKMSVADYFKVSFEELEPPIEEVWQIVQKICR